MKERVYNSEDLIKYDRLEASSNIDQSDLHHLLYRIAVHNEQKAFSMFFKLYHARLLLLAQIFVSSSHLAEDIVSEVLLKLLKNRKKAFKKKNFLGFLYTCIKNQALDHIRNSKKHKYLKLDNDNIDFFIQHRSDPCNQLIGKEFEEIIYDCIASLPPRRKLVYNMIKDDRMSYKEVAELLDISPRTVEVQLRFAMRHIKTTIEDYLACNP